MLQPGNAAHLGIVSCTAEIPCAYGKSTSAHFDSTGFCLGVLNVTFSECLLELFLAQMHFLEAFRALNVGLLGFA